jgi:hypothetical protein
MKHRTLCLRIGALLGLQLMCFAKTPTVTGKMVAYDPILHGSKNASGIANKEVIILETSGQKTKYRKLVFISFGTTQVDAKYFDGTQPLSVQAIRDHSCDENYPNMVPQLTLNERGGTYLLTDAFQKTPPGRIKNLPCYDVTKKKK